MKIYKIRNKNSGLFATGGNYPNFGKRGKVWVDTADLYLHLSTCNYAITTYANNLEVVEYKIQESKSYPLLETADEKSFRKKIEKKKEKDRIDKWNRELGDRS